MLTTQKVKYWLQLRSEICKPLGRFSLITSDMIIYVRKNPYMRRTLVDIKKKRKCFMLLWPIQLLIHIFSAKKKSVCGLAADVSIRKS